MFFVFCFFAVFGVGIWFQRMQAVQIVISSLHVMLYQFDMFPATSMLVVSNIRQYLSLFASHLTHGSDICLFLEHVQSRTVACMYCLLFPRILHHSFYCVFISKPNDFEFNTKKYNILSWMKIIQLDYSLTTVILWPFGPRNSPLSQENLTNLTEQDEEPKVPVVIIERLRLPGGFGGAQNIPTRWSDISKFDLEGDFCVLMERCARKCKISELDGEIFLNVWYLDVSCVFF